MKKTVALLISLCMVFGMLAAAFADPEVKTGSARGFEGDVRVEVTVEDGKITGLTVDDSGESYSRAGFNREDTVDKLVEAIVAAGTVEGVDTVTGATYTQKAVLKAVENALAADAEASADTEVPADTEAPAEAEAPADTEVPADTEAPAEAEAPADVETPAALAFTPGSYEASAKGFIGTVTAKVTFTETAIVSIEILASQETVDIGGVAYEALIPLILEVNGTGVDSVSGATYTSRALITIINDAAGQAGCTNPELFQSSTVEPVAAAPAE